MKKPTKLDKLRLEIENADTIMVKILSRREKTVLEIEKIKRKMGKPVFNKELEIRRINLAVETAKKLGLGKRSQNFVKKIITEIVTHCRNSENHQRKSAGKK